MPELRRITGRWICSLGALTWLCLAMVSGAHALDGDDTSAVETQESPIFDAAELQGADPKVAELAAHRLLQAIANKDEKADASRANHLNYLLERLEATRLAQATDDSARAGEIVSATRIVDALATWTTSSGPPFPQAAQIVQPLLGVGPAPFRSAVTRALKAIVLQEIKTSKRSAPQTAGAGSATLSALAAKLTENPPPSEAFIRDACLVHWEADGKGLLGTLLGVLLLHAGSPQGSLGVQAARTCIDELQTRVGLSFPSVEGWQKWWAEVRDWSVDRILADAQRRARDDYLALWRQLIRRLRETGDSERLFLAIQDTVDGVYALDLRLAAVSALGDFAEWAVDMPNGPGVDPAGGDPKDRLLSKGVERLCALSEARSLSGERPEVLRASLVALRKYHAFLERNPPLLSKVSRIVADWIQDLSVDGKARSSEDLAETLRIAGALRVAQAQSFVETLLREAGGAQEQDMELITVAMTCLGRLLEQGTSAEDAALILAQFRKPRAGPEKAQKELRRACLTALSSGSESPQVRNDLRTFLKDVVWGAGGGDSGAPPRGDKDLRIPSILALGTLARQKDAGAFDSLTEILSRQDQFETQEVAAALDSLSYLGSRPVVAALSHCLTEAKDKIVQDHTRKKLLSLVESTGGSALLWTLEELEGIAIADDSVNPIEQSLSLLESPQAKALSSVEKVDPSSPLRVEALFKTLFAMARAADGLERDEILSSTIARLGDLLQKVETEKSALGDLLGEAASTLAAFKASSNLRSVLKAKLSKPDPQEPTAILKELETLAQSDPSLSGRWRNLRWAHKQLTQATSAERLERIRTAWQATLSSDSSRPLWEGLPPKLRERILGRLDGATPARQ